MTKADRFTFRITLMVILGIITSVFLVMFSSCYTAKQDTRRVYKVHYRNQGVLDKYCAENRPCIDSFSEVVKYIQGEDIVSLDTVVQVYSILDTVFSTKYITKTIHTTDTLYKDAKATQTDKKAMALLFSRLEEKDEKIKDLSEKLAVRTEQRDTARSRFFWLAGIVLAYLIWRFIKWKFLKR